MPHGYAYQKIPESFHGGYAQCCQIWRHIANLAIFSISEATKILLGDFFAIFGVFGILLNIRDFFGHFSWKYKFYARTFENKSQRNFHLFFFNAKFFQDFQQYFCLRCLKSCSFCQNHCKIG